MSMTGVFVRVSPAIAGSAELRGVVAEQLQSLGILELPGNPRRTTT
jgi:hypothetical protein